MLSIKLFDHPIPVPFTLIKSAKVTINYSGWRIIDRF